ncbi:MAG: hypothetical protein ACFCUH_00025 [Flavobacteriales bacterium]
MSFFLTLLPTNVVFGQVMHVPNGTGGIGTALQGSSGVSLNSSTASATLHIRNRPGPLAGVGMLLLSPSQFSDMQGNPVTPAYTFQSLNTQGNSVFEIKSSGLTYVGAFSGFSQLPLKRLNVRNEMAVFGGNHTRYLALNVPTPLNSNIEVEWRTDDAASMVFQSRNNNVATEVLYLSPEGKVGVGTDYMPGNHSLYVRGSLIMEEGFVKLEGNWPDYVFTNDYPLMPLSDLKAFIEANGHLPGFPTASQVVEQGVALGETERLLTEKVEELVLYVLMLNAELDALRDELKKK